MNVKPLSQRDPRWANKKLGTSNTTIGDFGCTLTCMTMLCNYYGFEETPESLNRATVENNGFVNGNLYVWTSISKIHPQIKLLGNILTPLPVTSSQFRAIDRELEVGRPVVIQVDMNPTDAPVQMHYVLITSKESGEYKIADPWYGDIVNLSRYGKAETTIQQFLFYEGPVPAQEPDCETIKREYQEKIEELVTVHADELEDEKKSYQSLNEGNKKLIDERNNLRVKVAELEKQEFTVSEAIRLVKQAIIKRRW